MKKLALLVVAVFGTTMLATAAPLPKKVAPAKEVMVVKHHKHKTKEERKAAKAERKASKESSKKMN